MSNIQATNHDMVMPEGLAEVESVINDYQFEVLKSIMDTTPEFGPGRSQFKLAESNSFHSEHPFINSVNERLSAIFKKGNLQAINGDSDLDLFALFIAEWGAQRVGHSLQDNIKLHSMFNGAQSDGGNIVIFLASIDDELFNFSVANNLNVVYGARSGVYMMNMDNTGGHSTSAKQYCPLDGAKLNEFRLNSADNNDNQNKIAAAINAFLSCGAQDLLRVFDSEVVLELHQVSQEFPEFQHLRRLSFLYNWLDTMDTIKEIKDKAAGLMYTIELGGNEADVFVFEHNFFNVTETE